MSGRHRKDGQGGQHHAAAWYWAGLCFFQRHAERVRNVAWAPPKYECYFSILLFDNMLQLVIIQTLAKTSEICAQLRCILENLKLLISAFTCCFLLICNISHSYASALEKNRLIVVSRVKRWSFLFLNHFEDMLRPETWKWPKIVCIFQFIMVYFVCPFR